VDWKIPDGEEELAQLKNTWYVDYINQLTAEEILPGVLSFLRLLDTEGIKTALCSASKNAPLILITTSTAASAKCCLITSARRALPSSHTNWKLNLSPWLFFRIPSVSASL